MSFSLKAGLILGTSIAAACLALILVSPPAAPAAEPRRARRSSPPSRAAARSTPCPIPPAARSSSRPTVPAARRSGACRPRRRRAHVLAGAPLVDPVGLAVSADGRRLLVADPGADRILVVTRDGRTVRSLAGSVGTRPRGLDVQPRGAGERIVFTGIDPSDRRPAVLALGARGAKRPAVLAKGLPLRRPQGVAVARDGTLYVSDRGLGRRLDGRVLRIAGGQVTMIARSIRLGNPAGSRSRATGRRCWSPRSRPRRAPRRCCSSTRRRSRRARSTTSSAPTAPPAGCIAPCAAG